MSEVVDLAYYKKKNRDLILNKAKDFLKNNKVRLRTQARDKYKSFSEEGKSKKREYGNNKYHIMAEKKSKD